MKKNKDPFFGAICEINSHSLKGSKGKKSNKIQLQKKKLKEVIVESS